VVDGCGGRWWARGEWLSQRLRPEEEVTAAGCGLPWAGVATRRAEGEEKTEEAMTSVIVRPTRRAGWGLLCRCRCGCASGELVQQRARGSGCGCPGSG